MSLTTNGKTASRYGFTLIEVLVVMAIIAMLLSLVAPRYFSTIDHSKETILKHDLATMRDAIDKYYSDKGEYPDVLDDLVSARYLREIPIDPLSPQANWLVIPPVNPDAKGSVFNIYSRSTKLGSNGVPYSQW